MFGFLNRSKRDPLSDARSADRWLATQPGHDALALQREVLNQLGRVTERDARLTLPKLEAVFQMDAKTAELRRTLTAQYVDHASRSSRIENQLWSAMFELTQAFLLAYQAFLREAEKRGPSGKWLEALPRLIARQLAFYRLDAKIRLFRYEQWIPAKWGELHGLFGLACAHQLERQALSVGRPATTTIEHEYLLVLVLHLVNTGNLTARQLEWIAQQLDEWCDPLQLALEPASVSSFYVDLGGREGLRRRTPAPLEGKVLFLDTRPLHAVLTQNALVLEQKIKAQPLSERTAKRSDQLHLLLRVAAQVDPEFKPLARRGERTAVAGTVDAIAGFQKICSYLREEEREPLPFVDAAKSFGSTMEIAVFGRMRRTYDRAVDLARQRLLNYAGPGGPWEVKDVSNSGFRLVAPVSVASGLALGTLAAIRPQSESRWMLGIVRRIKRQTSDKVEIGLQVIADALMGIDLIEQRKAGDLDYTIDGEATTVNGRFFSGLLLALHQRDTEGEVQSLVVPTAEFQPGRKVKLQTSRASSEVRFGRVIEEQTDWVWIAAEPTERSGALPIPADAGK